MFNRLRNWLEYRHIIKMGFTAAQWEAAIADWPVMDRYQGTERDDTWGQRNNLPLQPFSISSPSLCAGLDLEQRSSSGVRTEVVFRL